MGKRLDLLARKRDGSEFPVEVILSPFEDEGGLHVIAAVRDAQLHVTSLATKPSDWFIPILSQEVPHGRR